MYSGGRQAVELHVAVEVVGIEGELDLYRGRGVGGWVGRQSGGECRERASGRLDVRRGGGKRIKLAGPVEFVGIEG
jgi:hypothetical protein